MHDADDDRSRLLKVEFLGGPYDGQKVPRFTRPTHLPAELLWFVCEDVFRLLDGKDARSNGQITSAALYELELGSGAARYRFVNAISIAELTASLRDI